MTSNNQGNHHAPPKNWPKACDAAGLTDISAFGYCLDPKTSNVSKTVHNATVGECCSTCAQLGAACSGWVMPNGPNTVSLLAFVFLAFLCFWVFYSSLLRDGELRTQNQNMRVGRSWRSDALIEGDLL